MQFRCFSSILILKTSQVVFFSSFLYQVSLEFSLTTKSNKVCKNIQNDTFQEDNTLKVENFSICLQPRLNLWCGKKVLHDHFIGGRQITNDGNIPKLAEMILFYSLYLFVKEFHAVKTFFLKPNFEDTIGWFFFFNFIFGQFGDFINNELKQSMQIYPK